MISFVFFFLAFICFFVFSWGVVYFFQPQTPRHFFLLFILLFGFLASILNLKMFPPQSNTDYLNFTCALLAFLTSALTVWNTFYSVLWGFSGGLLAELTERVELRDVNKLIDSYENGQSKQETSEMTLKIDSNTKIDRMLRRRLPNLIEGKFVYFQNEKLFILPKGMWISRLTKILYVFFALGRGGGIVENKERNA